MFKILSFLVNLFEEIMLWNVYGVVMEHWAGNPQLLTIKGPFDPVNEANLCYNDHHIKQIILNFSGKKNAEFEQCVHCCTTD